MTCLFFLVVGALTKNYKGCNWIYLNKVPADDYSDYQLVEFEQVPECMTTKISGERLERSSSKSPQLICRLNR